MGGGNDGAISEGDRATDRGDSVSGKTSVSNWGESVLILPTQRNLPVPLQLSRPLRMPLSKLKNEQANRHAHNPRNEQGPGTGPNFRRPDRLVMEQALTQAVQYIGGR